MNFLNIEILLLKCLSVLFLIWKVAANLPSGISAEHQELLQKIDDYEVVTPYRIEGRRRRDASTRLLREQNGHVEKTTLVFDGVKHQFTVNIALNKGLFGAQYKETRVLQDGTEIERKKPDNCFYHGTVQGDENSTVSLSTCAGIEGIITTNKGSFLIHPLKSKEGNVLEEHLIFNSSDLEEEPVTCGHSVNIFPQREFRLPKETTNSERRVRRNIDSETKYVEFFLINDQAQFKKYKNETELRAKQLVNHVDSIYRRHHIRIALVKLETWSEGNRFHVDNNATLALENFLKYKSKHLDKDNGKHWDNVQLLTYKDFDGSTVGYAPIRSICGRRSAAVVQDHDASAARSASTMAHELGHNLGMRHDTDTCECPHDKDCIMRPYISSQATRFSTCSLNSLRKTLNEGYGTCLFDEPQKLAGPPICGNGFVEEGEQCDCGTQAECKNNCCNSTTCMLQPGAACSHGECCNDNCQFRSRGHLCREKHDECDLPEFCTGDRELCPEDTFVHDGIPCKNDQGYCYNGVCRNLIRQCQYLFGQDVSVGDDSCFNRNSRLGNPHYMCHNDTHGNYPCAQSDVKCGSIHCLSSTKKYPKIGQHRQFTAVTTDGKMFCLVPSLTTGDGQDLRFVQDGTKCAPDKMCIDSKCIPVSEAVPISAFGRCGGKCSGNGICNNKGHCHCNSGYLCPDCVQKGPDQGGSEDSGQGCWPDGDGGGVNVAAAVLIPLFLILIAVIVVAVYLKRKAIQDRINRYKLVRRTVSSRSARPKSSRQPSALRPTISGPTPAEFSVPESQDKQPFVRREIPVRPSAPTYVSEERSWPRPQQQSRPVAPQPAAAVVPRRPAVPPQPRDQPRTGHQSVPLFPPGAPETEPEPQEVVRPRPPPPRPGNQSGAANAPAKPLPPGKPKLPPSKHPAGHSSVPDLTSSKPKTPPVAQRANVPPRPKPRNPPGSHRSVPEFPDEFPVPKPRNFEARPGHKSVPLFDLPDSAPGDDVQTVRPSAVRANQAKPSPPRKPRAGRDDNAVDFRAGLKPVPKPWEKI